MNITIDENLVSTLEFLASGQNKTPEEYVTGIIGSHLFSKYRENLTNKIFAQIPETIISIETAIDETIQTAAENAIPLEQIPE